MKILNVELIKDPTGEMGWCYVVTTIPSSGSETITLYVILKPLIDMYKPKLFKPHHDLLENGRWEKLFNFMFDMSCGTKREYIERISSFQILLGNNIGAYKQPQESKKNTPYHMFCILNKKGLIL